MSRASRSWTARAYSARFRRWNDAPARIGLASAAAIERRLERGGERRQRVASGPLRAGRRHHAGAQLADHLLGDVDRLGRLRDVVGRERQPARFRAIAVAGHAVLLDQGGLIGGGACGHRARSRSDRRHCFRRAGGAGGGAGVDGAACRADGAAGGAVDAPCSARGEHRPPAEGRQEHRRDAQCHRQMVRRVYRHPARWVSPDVIRLEHFRPAPPPGWHAWPPPGQKRGRQVKNSTAAKLWSRAKTTAQAVRCLAGTTAASHRNAGNSVEVTRPIDSSPPAIMGGSRFTTQ